MLLREVAWVAGPSSQQAVNDQLERLRRLLDASGIDPLDRASLAEEADRVVTAMQGRWDQTGPSR